VLIDARSLPTDEPVDADICIVGAGPAGITLALELLGTGARICILESGGREPGKDGSRLRGGESVGYPYVDLKHVNQRALGGTSHCWQFWHACPLDRIDFEQRSGIPSSGWPFDRGTLVPFYRRAEQLCGLNPFEYGEDADADESLSTRLPVPPGSLVTRSLQALTSTFDEHAERLARSSDVRVLLHATSTELVTESGDGRVTSLRAHTGSDRSVTVNARVFVLAAGGIENPRLLLLSNRVHTRGLGNENDLVGRYFMEHLAARSGVIVPSSPVVLDERSLYMLHGSLYTESHRQQVSVRPLIALDERVMRDQELLNVAFLLEGQTRAFACNGTRSLGTLARAFVSRPRAPHLLRHGAAVLGDAMSVSRTIGRTLARRPARGEVLVLRVQSEQQPNPESRITLGVKRDALGLPMPRLDWRLSSLDTESIRRTQDILERELRAAGLGWVDDKLGDESPPTLFYGLYHHLGTTRMDTDPRQGVVDADCRVHGVSNLFVAGSSVFPTAGWANPTLTIVALAVRLGDHLKRALGYA
jgi:choline dehydrogenase-like flavoprotein